MIPKEARRYLLKMAAKGGHAAAAAMTPEQRRARAKKAGDAYAKKWTGKKRNGQA